MADFKNFKPALPLPMSFKIEDGQYGLQLGIFIHTESITHLIAYYYTAKQDLCIFYFAYEISKLITFFKCYILVFII